ncbi:hypothetical protein D3C72_673920 [compost metagenome]
MKTFNRLLLIIILIVGKANCYAQGGSQLPKIIPPSPEATSLGKYGDWPVSYYTGTPNINIPLYEIKTGQLSLPITLSYHASGVKVEEVPSWVGAAWTLNAGGCITRTVVGLADEKTNGYMSIEPKGKNLPNSFNVNNDNDYTFLTKVADNIIDSEPDLFFFNFAGNSGKFFMDENGVFCAMPYTGFKVIKHPLFIQPEGYSSYWEIVDNKGITYLFGLNSSAIETTETHSNNPSSNRDPEISSWYLSRIISSDKKDTINFEYLAKAESYHPKAQQSYMAPYTNPTNLTQSLLSYGYGFNFNALNGIKISNDDIIIQGNSQLNKIKWSSGEVIFSALTLRNDITGKVLDRIEVYNSRGTKVKHYDFSYTNNTKRLFLEKISEKSTLTADLLTHKFEYIDGLPDRYSDAQDHWGYYNGASNNNLIPFDDLLLTFFTTSLGIPDANRKPNELFMKSGMLKRIIYPSGGYTDFEFEAHRYYRIADGFSASEPGSYANTTETIEAQDINIVPVPQYPKERNITIHKQQFVKIVVDFKNYRKGPSKKASWLPSFKLEEINSNGTTTTLLSWNAFDNMAPGNYVVGPDGTLNIHLQSDQYSLSPGNYRISCDLTCGFEPWECGTFNPMPSAVAAVSYDKFTPPSQSVDNSMLAGGLRIKKISDYDGQSSVSFNERSFEYLMGENRNGQSVIVSSGVLITKPDYKNIIRHDFVQNTPEGYQTCFHELSLNLFSNSQAILGTTQGSHIGYTNVNEYFKNGINGKNIYSYSYFSDVFNDINFSDSYKSFGRPTSISPTSNDYKRGLLLEVVNYKTDINGYLPVKSTSFTYSINDNITKPHYVNLKVLKVKRIAPALVSQGRCLMSETDIFMARPLEFAYGFCNLRSSWVQQKSKTETIYDLNGQNPVVTNTEYFYDNPSHIQTTRTDVSDSKGNILKTVNNYPHEMVTLGKDPTGVYQKMINQNIITPVIESKSQKNTIDLITTITGYRDWNNDSKVIAPEVIQTQKSGDVLENRVRYYAYNTYGKPSSVAQENGPRISYKWGYNGLYPISECKNASENEYYYEGFEDNTLLVSGTGHSGKRYFTGDFTVTYAKPNSRNYLISYWYLLNGKWVFVEKNYMPNASNQLLLAEGDAIDDIRIYPDDAQMITYTYEPLVGMTSSTDAKGKTTYYVYDGFQRLKWIKDQEGNILKTTDYHYQNQ